MVGWEAESYTKAGEERFGPHLRGKPWQRGPTGLALSSWAQHHFAHPQTHQSSLPPHSQLPPHPPSQHPCGIHPARKNTSQMVLPRPPQCTFPAPQMGYLQGQDQREAAGPGR